MGGASSKGIALAVAVSLCAAAPLHGQAVQGQVLDSVSGTPIGRGFVVLLNEAGLEAARTRAADDGRFAFRGILPGQYRLRSERIGYKVWESERFAFRGAQPLYRTLRIVSIPTELAALVIRGNTRCGDSRSFVEFSAVWEEARKALSAASWTAHQRGYRHVLHRYRRVRDARSGKIEHEEIWVRKGRAMQPFASIGPDRLATGGYVVQQNGHDLYYGPDANVLLHDSFHRTHCFKAVRGRGAFEGLIGLAFGPDPAHKSTDIDGTLWIDPETSELQRIEYQYTNLPSGLRDRRLGGSIVFRPLASGAWILERWEIRMPIAAMQLVTYGNIQRQLRPTRTRELTVKSIRETGGQVIEMLDADGQFQYTSPDIAYVRGVVFDSTRAAPLADELVTIVGTGYSARTDSLGHFAMKTGLDGVYSVTSGRLDSLGYSPGRATRRFRPRSAIEVALIIPGLPTAHRYLCPETGIPEHARALVGIVRDLRTDSPVQRASVVASWRVVDDETELGVGYRSENRKARTDEQGRYVLCQLPVGPAIHVEVPVSSYAMSPIEISFEDDEVVIQVTGERRTFKVPDRIWKLDVDLVPSDRGGRGRGGGGRGGGGGR